MSKSVIYAANTVSQTGSVIDFGNIIRRYGCNLKLSGGNIEVTGAGYYDLDVNITFLASGAGTATIQVYFDGVAVPGAKVTFTTESATNYAISIPSIIKQNCNCTGTIAVVISGVAGNVSNAGIVVEKE